jgi:hypothetical protein
MIVGIVMVEVDLKAKMSSFEFDIGQLLSTQVSTAASHLSQVDYVPHTVPANRSNFSPDAS